MIKLERFLINLNINITLIKNNRIDFIIKV